MVQASINNERDFDRIAEDPIIQHPRIHLREIQKRSKGKGKDGFKRGIDVTYVVRFLSTRTTRTSSPSDLMTLFPLTATNVSIFPRSVIHVACATTWLASEVAAEKKLETGGEEKNDPFSPHVTFDNVSVFEAAELDAIALLADTWDNDLDPQVSAQLVQANAQAYLSAGKEKGGTFPVRPSHLSLEDRRRRLKELKQNRMPCLRSKRTRSARPQMCDVSTKFVFKARDVHSSHNDTATSP